MTSNGCSLKLKSCPFCGSFDLDLCVTVVYWIRCNKCGGETASGNTAIVAASKWNLRAPEAQVVVKFDVDGQNVGAGRK